MNTETKHTPELQEVARMDIAQRVQKLSRPSRWLLSHLAEKHPVGVGACTALPCFDDKDQPHMTHMNGLIKRTWAEEKHNGCYYITDAGLVAFKAWQQSIASAPDMAKEIAQLKQQNEELKAHEQEIRDCWTEERTDHNKAREEIAQLRADKAELVQSLSDILELGLESLIEGLVLEESYNDRPGREAYLENLHETARNLIAKHSKV